MSYSHVTLVGGIGQDAELKSTTNGKQVANFSVAVDKGWGDNKTTIWVSVVAWEKLAEIAGKIVKKGRQVIVGGSLDVRSWDDKQTGKKVYRTEVIASDIKILDGREKSDGQTSRCSAPAARPQAESEPRPSVRDDFDDDIPF